MVSHAAVAGTQRDRCSQQTCFFAVAPEISLFWDTTGNVKGLQCRYLLSLYQKVTGSVTFRSRRRFKKESTSMLMALMADAIFIAAVFFEILATLSILQAWFAFPMREVFEPMLGFYRGQALPFLSPGTRLVYAGAPQWFVDASIFSAVFFFLFFIAQARRGMAPYSSECPPATVLRKRSRAEAAVDWALPPALCALGSVLLAPTLLPLLTLPAALVLGLSRLAGKPSWFAVSRSYYVNILVLGAVAGSIWALPV